MTSLALSLSVSSISVRKPVVSVGSQTGGSFSLDILGNKPCIVWFQKISIPPPRRELEIPEGWGGQWLRKFQRGGGVNGWISFQRVNFTFMSDIVVQNSNLPT